MGLDMYLSKYTTINNAKPRDITIVESYLGWKDTEYEQQYSLYDWCGIQETDIDLKLVDLYKPYYVNKYASWDTNHQYPQPAIRDHVGYWRKANAIHNWFVENVQNGIDDCGIYEVTKSQLEDLLETCKQVQLTAIQMVSPVENGQTYTLDDGWQTNYIVGKTVINPQDIEHLLPTCSGFFFGSTNYDNFYMDDIQDTINILTKVLETTDFTKETVAYSSSW